MPRLLLRTILAFGLSIFAYSVVFAQQNAETIIINYPEIDETTGSQILRLYFTVLDGQGAAVPDTEVELATVVLDNGQRIEVEPVRPDTPLYIVMVLDTSGSMEQAMPAMRQAAIEAVNIAPQQAIFGIVQFNEDINVIQGFTSDRNQVANVIGGIRSENKGTCLRDATFTALELLGSLEPTARRAVILFTDGRDERTAGQGDTCSTHTTDEVIELAIDPRRPIPVHTIGLGGSATIDTRELETIATSTGGLTAVGDQAALSSLFQRIMDALRSQWLAETPICIDSGTHSVTLIVGNLAPDAAQFTTESECVPATATVTTATPTLRPLGLSIESTNFNEAAEEFSFRIRRRGDGTISKYLVQIYDGDTNVLITEFEQEPAEGAVTSVAFSTVDQRDRDIRIVVLAVDENEDALADEEIDVVIARATPTPSATLPPVGMELTSVEYDTDTDTITLNLRLAQADDIDDFQVSIIDNNTNLLINTYEPSVATQIQISPQGLTPGGEYLIRITGESPGGENLRSEAEFTYTRELTPTPTISPTPEIKADLQAIELSPDKSEIIIRIASQNESDIQGYRLRIVNKATGLLQEELIDLDIENYEEIRLAGDFIPSGEYTFTLTALDSNNRELFTSQLDATYNAPPKPTATPSPGAIEQVTDAARDNPIIVLAILLIALVLIALFIWLVRSRRSRADMSFSPLPSAGKTMVDFKVPGAKSSAEIDDRTEILTVAPQIPPARLIVMQTPDSKDANFKDNWFITKTPYKIGRQNADMTVPHDKGISRHHVTITFENDKFFIQDEASANGTSLNSQPLTANQRTQLMNGAIILLGQNTRLRFEQETDDNATQVFTLNS